MNSWRAAIILLIVATIFGISGCATVIVNGIRKTEGSPGLEVRSRGSYLEGNYLGDIEQDGYRFARIIILNPRAVCDDQTQIEMLLPLTSAHSARPLLREVQGITNEKENRVKILLDIYDEPRAEAVINSESWAGYPSSIIIRHESNDPPTVFYRFGPGQSDLRHDDIATELKWVCRSRAVYFGSMALLPFAVAFDIVTFPLQLIVIALGH